MNQTTEPGRLSDAQPYEPDDGLCDISRERQDWRLTALLISAFTCLYATTFLQAQTSNTTHLLQTRILTNNQTGASYTIQATDCGKLVTFSNAAAVAVTLPQTGTTLAAGCWMDLQNIGVGTVTVTSTVSTIDGSSGVSMNTGQGLRLVTGSNNYYTQRGLGSESGSGTGSAGVVNAGSSAQLAYYPAAGAAVSGSGCSVGGSQDGDLTCNSLTTNGSSAGEIDLYPSGTSAYIGLAAPATNANSYTLTLPAIPPASGQVLNFSTPSSGFSTGSWLTPMATAGVGTVSGLPSASSTSGQYYIAMDSSNGCQTGGGSATVLCYSNGTTWASLTGGGGGGGAASWGNITGTLSNQTDLNSALNLPYASLPTAPGTLTWSQWGTLDSFTTNADNTVTGESYTATTNEVGEYFPVNAAASFTTIIAMVTNFDQNVNGSGGGLLITDGTKGIACSMLVILSGGSAFTVQCAKMNSTTSYNSAYPLSNFGIIGSGPSYYKPAITPITYWSVSWNLQTTTLSVSLSVDGGHKYWPLFTDSAPFLTPHGIGIQMENYNSGLPQQITILMVK